MLVNYSSSSDEDTGAVLQHGKRKRKHIGDHAGPSQTKRVQGNAVKEENSALQASARLPLPLSVQEMFRDEEELHLDDASLHGGRARSFHHERGNWATHVYLPYEPEDVFLELLDELRVCSAARGVDLTRTEDFHMSLSRTVVLRHHWIQLFVKSLRTGLTPCRRFVCLAGKLKVYSNPEKTRTFLGMEVSTGHTQLQELVRRVDETMEEFTLSTFYKDPSFHVSLAWCVGDLTERLQDACLKELQSIVDGHDDGPFRMKLNCEQLRCNIGNKVFLFPLQ